MGQGLQLAAEQVSDSTSIIAAGVLAAVVQLACLVYAALQYRRIARWRAALLAGVEPARPQWSVGWVPWLCLAAMTAVPLLTLRVDAAARELLASVTATGASGAEGATVVARAVANLTNAVPFGLFLVWSPTIGIGGAASAISWCAVSRGAGLLRARALETADPSGARAWLQCPGPELWAMLLSAGAFLIGGVFPMVLGVLRHYTELIAGFGKLAQLEARAKVPALLGTFETARPMMDGWYAFSLSGIAVATVVTIGTTAYAPIARRRQLAPSSRALEPPAYKDLVWTALCLAATAAVVHAAAPFRAENRDPIPAREQAVYGPPRSDPPTPDLTGTDRVELSPLLRIALNGVTLDGRAVDSASLQRDLETLRRNWTTLHPDEEFSGLIAVQCQTGIASESLRPFLLAALRASYGTAQFVVGRWRDLDRPVLGKVWRADFTAVRARLTADELDPGDARAERVGLATGQTCDGLAAEIIGHRKAGRTVQLKLLP